MGLVLWSNACQYIDDFRINFLANAATCVVSRKGKSWSGGVTGPGIEAAHIVPQIHWNTCPVDQDARTVGTDFEQLRIA